MVRAWCGCDAICSLELLAVLGEGEVGAATPDECCHPAHAAESIAPGMGSVVVFDRPGWEAEAEYADRRATHD